MISDQQGRNHGSRRNLEGLYDKHANGERQQHGDDDRFRILSNDGLASSLVGVVGNLGTGQRGRFTGP